MTVVQWISTNIIFPEIVTKKPIGEHFQFILNGAVSLKFLKLRLECDTDFKI